MIRLVLLITEFVVNFLYRTKMNECVTCFVKFLMNKNTRDVRNINLNRNDVLRGWTNVVTKDNNESQIIFVVRKFVLQIRILIIMLMLMKNKSYQILLLVIENRHL